MTVGATRMTYVRRGSGLAVSLPLLALAIWGIVDTALFFATTLHGSTSRSYFLVASGFTLVFGLFAHVNLAPGLAYLLGA